MQGRHQLALAVEGACLASQRNWASAHDLLQRAYADGCRDEVCYRWLTVKCAGTTYPEIALEKAAEGEEIKGGMSAGFVFYSEDCVATHKTLADNGVEFVEGPTTQMWGIQAIFNDPDGNTHLIVQPTPIPEQS